MLDVYFPWKLGKISKFNLGTLVFFRFWYFSVINELLIILLAYLLVSSTEPGLYL
jgi:hypothetical protein